jgi:hypothetical protein
MKLAAAFAVLATMAMASPLAARQAKATITDT